MFPDVPHTGLPLSGLKVVDCTIWQQGTYASAMLADIRATAARYRKEGKRMFTEIEACSSATDEVRRLCESFRDKLAVREAEPPK